MIQLTFTFDSVDAVAEFLTTVGEFQGVQTPQAASAPQVEIHVSDVQPEKKLRKPRADAGKPRGPYKEKAAEAPATTAAPAGPDASPVVHNAPDTGVPAAAVPAPTPEQPAKEPTLDDVKAAMSVLSKKVNIDANIQMLAKFGVQKASALPKEKYAEFIAAVLKAAGAA